MIDITAMSDFHGKLIEVKEKADLFIICGDISPLNIQSFTISMTNWLELAFIPWINSLPYKDENSKCILIAGNHDFIFLDYNGKNLEKLSDRLV